MIQKHLEDEPNATELPCLIVAMEEEPLYQEYLDKMREHCCIHRKPQPSRKRSHPMVVPNKRPQGKLKAMPKGTVRFEVPGPQSAASSSGSLDSPRGTARFKLPGLQPAATSSSESPESMEPYPWELDKNEWVIQGCWVCAECTSMNMRLKHWCQACGGNRELMQVRRPDDRDCPWCGILIFARRRWCPWSDCPSKDWMCPECLNDNYASRLVCNRRHCQQPRPW